jgi:hypothetical protein
MDTYLKSKQPTSSRFPVQHSPLILGVASVRLYPVFILLFILILGQVATAARIPQEVVEAESHNKITELWKRNNNIQDEIQCYALPYGVVGVISHLLTYYTTTCIGFGVKPFWPTRRLSHNGLNIIICVVSLIVTVVMTSITMKNCRNSWPFVLIAFWKMTMSLGVNLVGLIRGCMVSDEKDEPLPLLATLIYWIGTFIGIVGLFQVVHETFNDDRNVRILTGLLIAVSSLTCLSGWIYWLAKSLQDDENVAPALILGLPSAATLTFGVIIFFAVFYSDLVLAALKNDWVGSPSGPLKALYWVYFVAKRLPMFAT